MVKPPLILRVADYAPDQPDYMNGASDNVMNVIPRTQTTYGPMQSPSVFSGALAKRCQGAYFGIDSGGNIIGFAGDANDLYMISATTSPAWTQVSKSAGAYSLAADEQWKFFLYGTRVIATNFTDPPQSYLLGVSSSFSDLNSNAPHGRYGATVRSFAVFGDTTSSLYGDQHQRVWWSANGDPTNWPAAGSQQAAQYESQFQDLLGEGGWIHGIVGNLGGADGAVFMEHAIWRMVFVGSPAVFDFFPAEGVRGTPAPGSIAQLGAVVYYLGEDGFYVFDGNTSSPIGANKVDRTFFNDVDLNYLGSISSAIDPINKLYIVLYPGAGHTGPNCNKMLIFNWQLQKWSSAIPIPAGAEYITRALSFGYTLDQLYTILGYSLDTLPFALDSRAWTGGNLLIGIFDTPHKLNFFTGNNLAATVDTSENQYTPGGVTRFLNSRPIIDGSAAASVSLGVRNIQTDTPTFGPAITVNSLGTSPQRIIGRYARARLSIPANATWTHLSGVELEGAPAGARY